MEIQFRPHHFLCALCFQGNGYSPDFVNNFQAIMTLLNSAEGDDVPINITQDADSICNPCPNRIEKSCVTAEKIAVLDNAHAVALNIKAGEMLTWGDAKTRIREKITLKTFHEICASCNWKKLGICESVLTDFLQTK